MTKEIPRIIYLQWHNDESVNDDITWCEDKINDDDIEYQRSYHSGPWDDVLKALGGLYSKWARGGEVAKETRAALNDLMQAYDKWLD